MTSKKSTSMHYKHVICGQLPFLLRVGHILSVNQWRRWKTLFKNKYLYAEVFSEWYKYNKFLIGVFPVDTISLISDLFDIMPLHDLYCSGQVSNPSMQNDRALEDQHNGTKQPIFCQVKLCIMTRPHSCITVYRHIIFSHQPFLRRFCHIPSRNG